MVTGMSKIPYEREEQRVLVKWLRKRDIFIYAIPNHKDQKAIEGAIPGIPDLQIVLPEGKVLWIELKRTKGGAVSAVQKKVHAKLESMGHRVKIAKGAKEAVEWIKSILGPDT